MDAALPLCTTCGLCCDGTLFAHAPIDTHEVEGAAALGLKLDVFYGREVFCLPCPCLDGAICQACAERPTGCRSYACETLKDLEAGEISRAEAERRIALTRQAAAVDEGRDNADRTALEDLLDLYFRRSRVREAFEVCTNSP